MCYRKGETMYRLSHIQIKVKSIEQGINDFEKLGFTVERGGRNSRNAFIWFEQGTFIELLEMHNCDKIFGYFFGMIYGKAMKERWKKWCQNREGLIDFAIEPSDSYKLNIDNFQIVRQEAQEMTLYPSKVITWSRRNIRGEKVCFSYLPILPSSLPFFVSSYDIPQKPNKIIHRNGAKKIRYIDLTYDKDEYAIISNIIMEDPYIRLHLGNTFRINSIGIEGLNRKLETRLLHKAKIERC